MPTPEEIMIAQLDAADLQPALYRTARRIIDRLNPANNYCRVTYDEMAAIASTDNQATARAHLTRLAAAGLVTYRRNSAVHIYWHADAPTTAAPLPQETAALPAFPPSVVSETRALSSESRALDPIPAEDTATETRALSSESRANCSETRALSSESRAAKSTTTTSRQAGLELSACLPAGKGAGENQPQPPTAPASAPLTETQQRALAMLTDPAIGLDEPAALRIARRFGHGMVLTQCCRYLRDVATGKVEGPGVIGYRLSNSYGGSILPQDHRTEFWERHGERTHWLPEWQQQAEADALTADDDAAPVPVAEPVEATPKPEPGSPEAYWAQLQADFALHQPVGGADSVLQDSWVIAYADGVFTIGIADGFRLDWVEKKLRNQVKRRLAVIMRLATVEVTFRVVAPDE